MKTTIFQCYKNNGSPTRQLYSFRNRNPNFKGFLICIKLRSKKIIVNVTFISFLVSVKAVIVVFNAHNHPYVQFENEPGSSDIQLVSDVISVDLFDRQAEITQLDQPISITHSISKVNICQYGNLSLG